MILKQEFSIKRKELKAYGKTVDEINSIVKELALIFNNDIGEKISMWQMIKAKLGLGVIIENRFEKNGLNGSYKISSNKDGFNYCFNLEINPEVFNEIYAAYIDIIKIYIPTITTTITGIKTANALVKKRIDTADKAISKL